MNLTINGQLDSSPMSQAFNLTEMMQSISDKHLTDGMGILRVKLDGQDITGKDWSRFAGLTAADIGDLEVQTGNKAQLAHDVLISLEDFSKRLSAEFLKSAESFRLGQQQAALESFTRTLDGLRLIGHTAEMVHRHTGKDPAGLVWGGGSVSDHFAKLEPLIEDLLDSQEKADWVMLADLMEYEFAPYFEERAQIFHIWSENVLAG